MCYEETQKVTNSEAQCCSTAPARGRDGVHEGRDLVIGSMFGVRRRLPHLIEQQINLGEREAGDLHIEFQIDRPAIRS